MNKLLSLVLLCITLPAFAQINFEQGYFINSQGSKTSCLIRNVAWKNNPTTFDYKLTEGAAPQTGTINEVAEFSVGGYKFIKYTIDIDRSARDISNMSAKKDPEFKKETHLLKILATGPATLYQYKDGSLERYFYTLGSVIIPMQLVYKEYKTGTAINYNNMFRQQLYNAMAEKITDKGRFENLKYGMDDLSALFILYNGDKGTTVNNAEGHNKSAVNIKFTPGLNFARLDAARSSFSTTNAHNFDAKPVLRLGVEIEVILPFNNNKWALFTDPNYFKYSDTYTSDIEGVVLDWNVNYSAIEVPAGIRHYMYVGKKARLFIDAAYVFAFNVATSRLDFSYTSTTSNYTSNPDFSVASNAVAGFGFSYDNYSIEARYGFSRNILAKHVAWKGDYSSFGLILGYKLF